MKKNHYQTARCILYRNEQFLLADHRGTPRTRSAVRRSRARDDGKIKWGLPGGHIEWREEPIDAARREILEELNITLGSLVPVGDYSYKQHLHAVFAAPSDCSEFDLESSELAAVRWFTLDEISRLANFDQLHAGYEYDAARTLAALLGESL